MDHPDAGCLVVRGERREDCVGVWVKRPDKGEGEDKIAVIGVRLRRWSRSTASRSMWSRTFTFLGDRAPAVSLIPATVSPRWSTSAFP